MPWAPPPSRPGKRAREREPDSARSPAAQSQGFGVRRVLPKAPTLKPDAGFLSPSLRPRPPPLPKNKNKKKTAESLDAPARTARGHKPHSFMNIHRALGWAPYLLPQRRFRLETNSWDSLCPCHFHPAEISAALRGAILVPLNRVDTPRSPARPHCLAG